MNRSTLSSSKKKTSISLSKACDGFLKFKVAEGLSQRTIESYEYCLNQWIDHIGDQDAANIRPSDLTNCLVWLRTDYKPKRWNQNRDPLAPKSMKNVYTPLKSFFKWLSLEFDMQNPFVKIQMPKSQQFFPDEFDRSIFFDRFVHVFSSFCLLVLPNRLLD